jgi:hypothetical protein
MLAVIVLSFPLAAWGAETTSPTCENLVGVWHNPINSTMTITSVDPSTGLVTGTYHSAAVSSPVDFKVTGWINSAAPVAGMDNAKVISFAVRFSGIGSISAWTGTCRNDKKTGVPTLSTLYHLIRPNSKQEYDHIATNSEVFTPGPPPS